MKTEEIKIKRKFIIRLEPGDEIIQSVNNFCWQEGIEGGYFIGLGAVDNLKIARYLPEKKSYEEKEFTQPLEIVSLFGIYSPDGIHCHIVVSDRNFISFGGHLRSGKINATAEIIFYEIGGELKRSLDKDLNLNLLKL